MPSSSLPFQKRAAIMQQLAACKMRILDEVIIDENEMKSSNEYIFENLKKRCEELIEKHPEKQSLFENYIRQQEEENDALETEVVCSTMVITAHS